jgi:hypothetical protein
MMGELGGFDSGPISARSELAAVYGRRSRRGHHQGKAATWEGGCGLVYARVSEAGEIDGEGPAAELYLAPVDKAAWAAGDKHPIVAAGIAKARTVEISALLRQGQRHAVDVRV